MYFTFKPIAYSRLLLFLLCDLHGAFGQFYTLYVNKALGGKRLKLPIKTM